MKVIVYTDLDGTLLDAVNYSWEVSLSSVEKLKKAGIPLLFNSSKTFKEIIHYQESLGLLEPFIFENGSGIAIPEHYFGFEFEYSYTEHQYLVIEEGILYDFILEKLRTIFGSQNSSLVSFEDLSLAELSKFLNMEEEMTRRARERKYSVTLLNELSAKEFDDFNSELSKENIILQRGSRLITAFSKLTDKGTAVNILNHLFRIESGSLITYAIGDSENDIPMFIVCDHAMLVARYDGTYINTGLTNIIATPLIGPEGFKHFVERILTEIPSETR
jgi:mannosyl-3-phosphoglycerate phosphatase